MTWKKGTSGNPSGQNLLGARTRRMIEGLGPSAVARLEKLLASDNETVALGAAREILSRVAPAPKTGTLTIEHNATPHLSALVALAAATALRVHDAPENTPQPIDFIEGVTIDDRLLPSNVDVDAREKEPE